MNSEARLEQAKPASNKKVGILVSHKDDGTLA
jgi:hypothetical protein